MDTAFEGSNTIQTWIEGLVSYWGDRPTDMNERVALLAEFCDLVERTPDEIIAECEQAVDSGKRIRLKARRLYAEQIDLFQASRDGTPRHKAKQGNVIRSFMIHNGIFMQAGTTRDNPPSTASP